MVSCIYELEPGASPLLTELLALDVQYDGDIGVGCDSALASLPFSELGPVLHEITDKSHYGLREDSARRLEDTGRDWEPDGRQYARALQAICSSLLGCKDFQELHLNLLYDGNLRWG